MLFTKSYDFFPSFLWFSFLVALFYLFYFFCIRFLFSYLQLWCFLMKIGINWMQTRLMDVSNWWSLWWVLCFVLASFSVFDLYGFPSLHVIILILFFCIWPYMAFSLLHVNISNYVSGSREGWMHVNIPPYSLISCFGAF